MTKSKNHRTQNLYEAAYLYAKGFKLNGKDDEGQKTIIFLEGEGVHEEAMKYYNGGTIEAKAYTDSYRTIKDYIFER